MDTAIPRLTSFVTDGTYKATLGQRGEIVERKHGDITRFMVCVEVARQPPHLQGRNLLLRFPKVEDL